MAADNMNTGHKGPYVPQYVWDRMPAAYTYSSDGVSVYMPDLGEWDAMNTAYLEVFGPNTPARIAIGCSALLFGARAEFDCVAYTG